MFLQTILSLKQYVISDGVWGSDWVGLTNFKMIFTDPDMLRIIGNTLLISCSRIFISIIPPIILAIFLFDMGKERYRKGIQTIIYIPHFFSWVVIYGIAYAFINPEGLINNIIISFGGEPVKILTSESKFIPLLLFTDLWKELGWGTILYTAALSSVDSNLYEAAAIDGAGAWKKLIHITIPGIAPTIVFVSVMAVGNVLKGAGFEQIMLFGSENMGIAQVIDTWVIWEGLNGLKYGLGAAVSFFQSAIGLVLVLLCNKFSKRYVGIGLF
jgi:putative aldouronate transport system permease protein